MKTKRGKHRSAADRELERSFKWIESRPSVKKLILGLSAACQHKYPPGHVKIRGDVDGGFKANGYSDRGVVDLFVRVSPEDQDSLKAEIIAKFQK